MKLREMNKHGLERYSGGIGVALAALAALAVVLLVEPAFGQADIAQQPAPNADAAEPAPVQVAQAQPAAPEEDEPGQATQQDLIPQRDIGVHLAALKHELDQLLLPTGELVPASSATDHRGLAELRGPNSPASNAAPAEPAVAKRTEDLAEQAEQLAAEADDEQQALEARELNLWAYNALAQNAKVAGKPVETSFRLAQLRSSAHRTQAMASDEARLVAAFWLMMADLLESHNVVGAGVAEPEALQAQAAERMTMFLASDEVAKLPRHPIAVEARLSLLLIYDQLGWNAKACEVLPDLNAQLPPKDHRRQQLVDAAAACRLLGEPVRVVLPMADGGTWSLAAKRGHPVLLHFASLDDAGRAAEAAAISEASKDPAAADLRIMTVLVEAPGDAPGSARAAKKALPGATWPVCLDVAEPGSVTDRLGVRSLPRYVLIDARGRFLASGTTVNVWRAILPPVAAEETQPDPAPNAPEQPNAADAPNAAPTE